MQPFGFHFLAEALHAVFLHHELDARLVDVVAAAVAVVGAQHRFEVGEQMLPGQELADRVADHGRAAQSAANHHAKAHGAVIGAYRVQAHVVHLGRRGDKPTPPINLVGDFGGGGMLMAFGVACALLEATRSGQGQVVDAAMVDEVQRRAVAARAVPAKTTPTSRPASRTGPKNQKGWERPCLCDATRSTSS